MNEKKEKRTLKGVVVSSAMDKTRVVLIERKEKHPVNGKYIRRSTKIKAHDESNKCKNGDIVTIVEDKPIAKNKNWVILEIIEKS